MAKQPIQKSSREPKQYRQHVIVRFFLGEFSLVKD